MVTGDSNDIIRRIKRLIPTGWYNSIVPYSDAIIGGISDGASWIWSFIQYTKSQTRLATMTSMWLDLFAFDFFGTNIRRISGQGDDAFRAKIKAALLRERVTRKGMNDALTALTGNVPVIFEPWNTFDTGVWSNPTKMAYGVCGQYGNMALQSQAFITQKRSPNQGVPNVGGYGVGVFAYSEGLAVWTDTGDVSGNLTDQDIYDEINRTKPNGVTVWVRLT